MPYGQISQSRILSIAEVASCAPFGLTSITFASLSPVVRNVTLVSMNPIAGNSIAGTMPEHRFRSVKKRVQPAPSAPSLQDADARTVAATQVAEPQAVATPVKTARAKKIQRKRGEAIASWWPVGLGIYLAGFAPEWHAMAVDAGVWAVRIAFPFALLVTHREIGLDSRLVTILPQAALYLQFPLEGLLAKLALDRGKSLRAVIAQLAIVHAVATVALWLLSFGAR